MFQFPVNVVSKVTALPSATTSPTASGSNSRLDGSNRDAFEAALGTPVADEFALYQGLQSASLDASRAALGLH